MAFEACGIGDLHLTDSNGRGGLSKYIENSDEVVMNECDKVVKYAEDRGINRIFLYGDVCESPVMSYSAHTAFGRFIRRHPNIEFDAILGNHDKLADDSSVGHSLQLIKEFFDLPNLNIYEDPTTVKVKGVRVRFLPWPSEDFDKSALNIYHKEVLNSKLDTGRLCTSDKLTKSKAVIAAGHLHTNHRVRNTYFSGTLYQTNFGESIKKYFHHITFKSSTDYSIESIRHKPKYTLHTHIVNTKADMALVPSSKYELVKLIINDGCDVYLEDYSLPNVVVKKGYKTKQELETILTEDLLHGESLVIKTEDFYKSWLDSLEIKKSMKSRMTELREQLLGAK